MTIDEALQSSVGECGRGQIHVLALTSLTAIVAALVNFSFVFTGIDPVRVSQPVCSPETAATCDAQTTNAFCSIPRDSWDWRNRCERRQQQLCPSHCPSGNRDVRAQTCWDRQNGFHMQGPLYCIRMGSGLREQLDAAVGQLWIFSGLLGWHIPVPAGCRRAWYVAPSPSLLT